MDNITFLSTIGTIALSRWFQFGSSLAIAGTLAIAPTALKWGNDATLYSTVAGLGLTGVAYARSRGLQQDVELLVHSNRTDHRMAMESVSFQLDAQRAKHKRALHIIGGGYSTDDAMGMFGQMARELRQLSDVSDFLVTGQVPAGALPATDDTLQSFDLQQLKDSPKAHTLLVGSTGAGKTTLAQYLSVELFGGQDIAVYDCDDDGQQWGQFPVFGQEDNFEQIAACLKLDLKEFRKRSEERVKGTLGDRMVVRIFEEMPSSLPEVNGAYEWLHTMLRRGRKRKMAVVGVTQDRNVDALKCQDKEGKLQEISAKTLQNFTIIYLKGEAFAALDRVRDKEHRKQLHQALQQCDRPALVEFDGQFYWWDVPDLSNWQMPNLGTEAQVYKELCDSDNPKAQTRTDQLEQLYKLNGNHPVEDFYHLSQYDAELIAFFTEGDESEQSQKIDPELPFKFIKYCHSKGAKYADRSGWFDFETLRVNWARNNGLSAAQFRDFLNQINEVDWGQWQDAECRAWKPLLSEDDLP